MEFTEEKFQEAIEKLKEGAAENEKSPTMITHEDCQIILLGLENVCQQRNMAQQMIQAMDDKPISEAAYLAASLDKALNVIEKMTRGLRR